MIMIALVIAGTIIISEYSMGIDYRYDILYIP